MKLLVVSNMYPSKAAPSYGVFVKNFCEQLETLGIAYDLAVMRKGGNKLSKLSGYVLFYLKSFFKVLFGKYDIVYVHYASHSSAGVLLARKMRKCTIYTNCHGSDVIPQNAGQEKMQKNTRAILNCSEKIVVPSPYFKRVVAEKYAISQERIFVSASGGINEAVFFPAERTENEVFTIGFAARLASGKGWATLLKACALLPENSFRLLLIGDGPERGQMEQLLDRLNLRPVTELPGLLPQSALAHWYRKMDVFVFPFDAHESLGLVAIEAMACGTAVIASDFAAPADYVVNGHNGFKFPVGDEKALAQALLNFQNLPATERKKLQDGALQTAQRYTREKVTQALGKILLE